MKINPNMKLILSEVYVYDIESCHYTLMKNNGFDLGNIDPGDKEGRNIAIGKLMQQNPRITDFLRSTTIALIDEYITANDIEDDDIVIRQYDGLLLTRLLHKNDVQSIPLNLRKTFDVFISSIDKSMYIAMDTTQKIAVKGVPHRYPHIKQIYKKICQLNFINKVSLFKGLENIKRFILESNDVKLFAIPNKNNKFSIFLLGYGEMEVSPGTIKLIDTDEIDKMRYFDIYLTPFTKSIIAEFA
jgi:hypothetical protein